MNLNIKPANGYKIRDPELMDYLPDNGREVAESPYWIRLLREGDVVKLDPVPPPKMPVAPQPKPVEQSTLATQSQV